MSLGHVRRADRMMLWIDAVGGYWVCLGDEITVGRPDPQRTADVPILGDLSSRHARVRRDGEGYVIDALREVRLDERPVRGAGSLCDGSRIALGSVRLLFCQPHPLSRTARIEFLSHHRTQPSADAVLLMADTCVLGPGPRSHVVCHGWTQEVVLFRRQERLFCRVAGRLEIDGVAYEGSGPLRAGSHIDGEGLSFHLEAIDD
jgi:hypothetical protein